jgi:hypothetical protein
MKSQRSREKFYQRRKAAMQLSVSMMVILIISIVIFGFGIYLAGQVFKMAEDTEASVSAQAQKEIEARIMQSGDAGLGILNTFK